MLTWHAVYLERDAKEDDRPDALFANEDAALEWGRDNALETVDIIVVNIPHITLNQAKHMHLGESTD